MKLLQLNAWGGRLEPQISDLLASEKPDMLCLQEVIGFSKNGSGLFLSLEVIQEQFNLPYAVFSPVFSFQYMKGTANFGNAILSKFPIDTSKTIFTHMEHKNDFMWGEDSSNVRNFIHAEVNISGKACHVITHHGFWVPEHKNGTKDTEEQMKILTKYIKELAGPVILAGDFNLNPTSASLTGLNALLTNLSVKHRLKTTRTVLTYKTETCDYIFVNDQVKVRKFWASEKIVSDHKALILQFGL